MVQPTRGKLLCELLSDITELPSGLVLARTVKEKRHRAKVLSVGAPGLDRKGKLVSIMARPGDIVHFKQGFGTPLTYEGKKLVFLRNDEVLAVEEVR